MQRWGYILGRGPGLRKGTKTDGTRRWAGKGTTPGGRGRVGKGQLVT